MSSLKKSAPKNASKKASANKPTAKKTSIKNASSQKFPPKKASHQTSAPPPLPPGTSAPFRILIVEPYRLYSRSLHIDIRREGIFHTDVERVSSFKEAEKAIAERPPQVVILGLQLPDKGASRFFEQYPAVSRSFALILFDYRLEEEGTPQLSAREHLNNTNLVAEQQACGYLCVGIFNNQDLITSLERARRQVQNLILQTQQQQVIASLEEYLHHPFVIAVSKYAQEMSEQKRQLSPHAMAGALRFIASKEEYLVAFDRIVRVHGDGKYCYIFYYNAQNIVECKHVEKKWVADALPESLVRVHVSHWVNIVYICHIEEAEITLLNADIVPLSREGRKTLQNIFSHHSLQLYNLTFLQDSFDKQTKDIALSSKAANVSSMKEHDKGVIGGGGAKSVKNSAMLDSGVNATNQ